MMEEFANIQGTTITTGKKNARVMDPNMSRFAFDKDGNPQEHKVHHVFYTNNFIIPKRIATELHKKGTLSQLDNLDDTPDSAIVNIEDQQTAFEIFQKAERAVNSGTQKHDSKATITQHGVTLISGEKTNTPFGNNFFAESYSSTVEKYWRQLLSELPSGVCYTMIEALGDDNLRKNNISKVELAKHAAEALVKMLKNKYSSTTS